MRRARRLGQAGEELLVHVLVADVDLLDDEHVVQRGVERRLALEERRKIMAPAAPVAAGDQQQSLSSAVGLRDRRVALLEGIGVRVVADVLLRLRRRDGAPSASAAAASMIALRMGLSARRPASALDHAVRAAVNLRAQRSIAKIFAVP